MPPAVIKCEACGGLVSTAASACPHCGHPQGGAVTEHSAAKPAIKERAFSFKRLFAVVIVVCVIAWVFGDRDKDSSTSGPVATSAQAPQAIAAAPSPPRPASEADRLQAAMPPAQRNFLQIIVSGLRAYDAGTNEMQRGASRPARAQQLCAALPSGTIDGWVGRIGSLSSNNEGKGVLSISIGNSTDVKTWNNSLSDIGDNTLIPTNSALFTTASNMRVGQLVRFSAVLIRYRDDCFRESSMSVRGAMAEPEFVARFTRIEAL